MAMRTLVPNFTGRTLTSCYHNPPCESRSEMDTAAAKERSAETSPRSLARMAGAFQLLEAITAACGQVVVLGRLVVPGNPVATAANIVRHQQLFWFGFALSLLGVVF